MADDPQHQSTASLVERIEAARGADRDLDFAIAAAVGWPDSPHSHQHARRYTESLDAALALLSGRGVLLHLGDITADGLPFAHVGNPAPGGGEGKGIAATLPLALCAAVLRMEAVNAR